MVDNFIDLLSTFDRELIVEQTLRCNLLLENCIFNYNGYTFYYNIEDDLIVLKKVSKKIVSKKMILPPIFEAIDSYALSNLKNLVSLDAKYIKRIYFNGIKDCINLRWLNLSSCKYFGAEAISGSRHLCKIMFNELIDYLGESFIDGQNCTYYFKDIINLDSYSFKEIDNLRLVGNHFNSLFYANKCDIKINCVDHVIANFKYYNRVNKRVLHYGGTLVELEQKLNVNNKNFPLSLRSLRFDKIVASDGVFFYAEE